MTHRQIRTLVYLLRTARDRGDLVAAILIEQRLRRALA